VSAISPAASERGILFGEPGAAADGGVIYDDPDRASLQFRTGGNITRLQLESLMSMAPFAIGQ
jgi:trimeric autotransporter adhesin